VTPRVSVVDVELKVNETLHISPMYDVHLDDSLCDHDALLKMAAVRRELPNHHAVWFGDTLNLVVPPDLRRFRPSGQPKEISGRDDWVNATLDYVGDKIEALGFVNDIFGPGNHEDEFCKRYGLDVTSILAHRFNAARGGYSGVVDYRIHFDGKSHLTFRLVYHHGAWGGRMAKGYNSAWPFFASIDSWNMALFGHNHASRVDPEVRRRVHGGQLEEYPVFIVNCGAWVKSYSDDASQTHYAERHGYMVQPRQCPLIRVTPRRVRSGGEKNTKNRYFLSYSVEV
jgi:hypothetical protein